MYTPTTIIYIYSIVPSLIVWFITKDLGQAGSGRWRNGSGIAFQIRDGLAPFFIDTVKEEGVLISKLFYL